MGPEIGFQTTKRIEVLMLEAKTIFKTPEQVARSMLEVYIDLVHGGNASSAPESSETFGLEMTTQEDPYKSRIQHRRDLSEELSRVIADPQTPLKDKYETLTRAFFANFLSPFSITAKFPQTIIEEIDPLPQNILLAFHALGSSSETSAGDIVAILRMNYQISQIHRIVSDVLLPQYATNPDLVNIDIINISKEQLEDISRRIFPAPVIEVALNFAIISGMLSRQGVLTDDEREIYNYVRRRNASIMGWMQYLRYKAQGPINSIGRWTRSLQQASKKSTTSTKHAPGIDTEKQVLELIQNYDTLLSQQYKGRQNTILSGTGFNNPYIN